MFQNIQTNQFQHQSPSSIQSDRVESTTFSTHPQRPDVPHFPSLMQIDFRHDGTTLKITIHVDSIESGRISNISTHPKWHRFAKLSKSRANRLSLRRIDSKGHDSSRFDGIESNGHFQPNPKALVSFNLAQIDFRHDESTKRKGFVSNRVESTTLLTHLA